MYSSNGQYTIVRKNSADRLSYMQNIASQGAIEQFV